MGRLVCGAQITANSSAQRYDDCKSGMGFPNVFNNPITSG